MGGKGKSERDNGTYVVRFVIKSALLKNISTLATGINECIVKFRMSCYVTIVTSYAPALASPDQDKDQIIPTTAH